MGKRRNQIVLAVVVPLCGWFSYTTLRDLESAHQTRAVMQKITSARRAIDKMPPGLERAAEFLRQLKSIDSGRVPVEVKRALYEYIPAMEQSFEALKDRQDPSPFEAICTQKTAELNDAIQRNL